MRTQTMCFTALSTLRSLTSTTINSHTRSHAESLDLSGARHPDRIGLFQRRRTPNGENVTFMSGTTSLGTAQLTSGAASLTTTALPTGTDSITAVYGGDPELRRQHFDGSQPDGQQGQFFYNIEVVPESLYIRAIRDALRPISRGSSAAWPPAR